jgi:hypothetical protein
VATAVAAAARRLEMVARVETPATAATAVWRRLRVQAETLARAARAVTAGL